jgi:hypothetical protein
VADAALPQELTVLLQGRVAGVLRRGKASGSYVFTYDARWRNDASAFPLSLSLPLASQVHQAMPEHHLVITRDRERPNTSVSHRYHRRSSPSETTAYAK